MQKLLQYPSEIQAIPLIRADLEELAGEWKIPDPDMRQILLIIEELFSNTIRFAFHDELEHHVQVQLSRSGEGITIEIIDDGSPFNPAEYNPLHKSDPVASDDGGMGLTLIRTFSDSIDYARMNNRNHLVIRKSIKDNPV